MNLGQLRRRGAKRRELKNCRRWRVGRDEEVRQIAAALERARLEDEARHAEQLRGGRVRVWWRLRFAAAITALSWLLLG